MTELLRFRLLIVSIITIRLLLQKKVLNISQPVSFFFTLILNILRLLSGMASKSNKQYYEPSADTPRITIFPTRFNEQGKIV